MSIYILSQQFCNVKITFLFYIATLHTMQKNANIVCRKIDMNSKFSETNARLVTNKKKIRINKTDSMESFTYYVAK